MSIFWKGCQKSEHHGKNRKNGRNDKEENNLEFHVFRLLGDKQIWRTTSCHLRRRRSETEPLCRRPRERSDRSADGHVTRCVVFCHRERNNGADITRFAFMIFCSSK